MIEACLTDYVVEKNQISGLEVVTSSSNILTNCAFTYNSTTGETVPDLPSRIIIDDQYLKSEMPDGAKKYFKVPP